MGLQSLHDLSPDAREEEVDVLPQRPLHSPQHKLETVSDEAPSFSSTSDMPVEEWFEGNSDLHIPSDDAQTFSGTWDSVSEAWFLELSIADAAPPSDSDEVEVAWSWI